MLPEPTNLLPENRMRAFRRRYFFRLMSLSAFMLAGLIVVHSILLLPTHLLLASQISAWEGQLALSAASGVSEDEAAFEAKLQALSKSAARIMELEKAPSAISTLSNVLAIPRANVSVSRLTYTAASSKKAAQVALMGEAGTRDALREYQLALQGASFISAAELPVSTYAKDTNIPFTITLTLALP